MTNKWNKIEPTVTDNWDYKKEGAGSEIVGKLTNIKDDMGSNGSKIYEVRTKDGVKSFWGSTVLDARLQSIAIGEEVRITYKGLATSEKSGRNYHDFDVFNRMDPELKEEPIDLSEIPELDQDLDSK